MWPQEFWLEGFIALPNTPRDLPSSLLSSSTCIHVEGQNVKLGPGYCPSTLQLQSSCKLSKYYVWITFCTLDYLDDSTPKQPKDAARFQYNRTLDFSLESICVEGSFGPVWALCCSLCLETMSCRRKASRYGQQQYKWSSRACYRMIWYEMCCFAVSPKTCRLMGL